MYKLLLLILLIFIFIIVNTSQHTEELESKNTIVKKPLLCVPSICDGCGASFDLSHALICRKGGLVTQRHNEIHDALGDLSSLAWSQVKKEPIVKEADESSGSPALVADLSVRGVWVPQAEVLFGVRVIDTDAQSYLDRSTLGCSLNCRVREEEKIPPGLLRQKGTVHTVVHFSRRSTW